MGEKRVFNEKKRLRHFSQNSPCFFFRNSTDLIHTWLRPACSSLLMLCRHRHMRDRLPRTRDWIFEAEKSPERERRKKTVDGRKERKMEERTAKESEEENITWKESDWIAKLRSTEYLAVSAWCLFGLWSILSCFSPSLSHCFGPCHNFCSWNSIRPRHAESVNKVRYDVVEGRELEKKEEIRRQTRLGEMRLSLLIKLGSTLWLRFQTRMIKELIEI